MVELDDIIAPVRAEFDAFGQLLRQTALSAPGSFMRPITEDILVSGGKQMRPLLTLLVAKLCGRIDERALASAVLIEMIHWSTLVHDDVIDEGYMRRGEWTPAALLRSKTAVLVGDYLFSRGLAAAAQAGCFPAVLSATQAIQRIVDGELMQMEHSRRLDITEDIYTEVIRLKTGALLGSAAEAGALSALSSLSSQSDPSAADHAQSMYRFGQTLGMAFQVKDDLLDFGFTTGGEPTGKTPCNDLIEGKLTLPLIHALAVRPAARAQVRAHLRRAGLGGRVGPRATAWLRAFVQEHGGVDYAIQAMDRYHAAALSLLAPYPDSPAKTALQHYTCYVTARKF